MTTASQRRPEPGEYDPYYEKYIQLVQHEDVLEALQWNIHATEALLSVLPADKAAFRYETGKWTLKEVLGHMIDTERIFAYRALRFARGDANELAGFDQDPYVAEAGHNDCALKELVEEFVTVRKGSILMFRHLPQAAWARTGLANQSKVSVRALAWIAAGHELHHRNVIREKYLRPASASV